MIRYSTVWRFLLYYLLLIANLLGLDANSRQELLYSPPQVSHIPYTGGILNIKENRQTIPALMKI